MASSKGKAPAKAMKKSQPAVLTKIVAALMSSRDSAKRNKATAIRSISHLIEAKYAEKPAKYALRSAIDRGSRNKILEKPITSRSGLNGSIKIHPKFSNFLSDRETTAGNQKGIESAIREFVGRSSAADPEPITPKEKVSVVKKTKADNPVAKKEQDAEAKKGRKRPTKAQQDEPKTKKARK